MDDLVVAVSGAAGGAFSNVATYPLDTIKTRMNKGWRKFWCKNDENRSKIYIVGSVVFWNRFEFFMFSRNFKIFALGEDEDGEQYTDEMDVAKKLVREWFFIYIKNH